jgi:nucleoid-associated protein YgaU
MFRNCVGVCAFALSVLLCGCGNDKPPPVTLAREGLKLAEAGKHEAQPSPTNAKPVTTNPDPYAHMTSTRSPAPAVTPAKAPATSTKGAARTHVIQPGDTLYKLARQYYGDSQRWVDIHKANPQLTDPARLKVGETLTIPR